MQDKNINSIKNFPMFSENLLYKAENELYIFIQYLVTHRLNLQGKIWIHIDRINNLMMFGGHLRDRK